MSQGEKERNALIATLYVQGKSFEEILTELRKRGYKNLEDTQSLATVIGKLKKRGEIPVQRPNLPRTEKEWLWEIGQMSITCLPIST
jgi:hypothetical protein